MNETEYRQEITDENDKEVTVRESERIVCEGAEFKGECFEFNCPHQNGGQCWRM